MSMIFLLTGVALGIFAISMAVLFWAVRSGQFDDLDTPALRMLGDDAQPLVAPPTSDRIPPP
ncbi:MAG: cbb3-type cytochrome oxidase assembly protein CcoS [Planctomycetes bacterium]|jgi:cbb3-type cytochrome oxidase maturation protein|nr:cbb3-type cytochrome oxidase assembly protein CcoS [Planctomycetota bacterium]